MHDHMGIVESEEAQGNHEHSGPIVILFVFVGLFLGGLLRQANKRTGIPYTPMLLILGIMLGYFRQSLGTIGESTSIIEKLNPHMILLIFIPVLIFQSAFNCDWYVFRKSLINILVLAGPGVLYGAILIAFCFKIILFYPSEELTWQQALTLGCVLSATDPVAVVALLKSLGASVRFNTLVEGQSLMNDGTAMVFFLLFIEMSKGNTSSAFAVLGNLCRVALGGPLLGIIFGFLISSWMKRIIRDPILSINITFVGAFICFYIAEFTWVKVSGILSIVAFGLYMSAVGKRKIYPESEHALHNVWGYIQYSCETLIFILTGIVVGVEMIEESTITIWDWIRMFAFWALMILIRLIMVGCCYPVLSRNGYGLTKKQLVVLVYGGLRGALGLCLSLIVGVDDELPIRFRELTVFYMCGMAMLTIVVNGLTCGKIVNMLEMIQYPMIKKKLLDKCIKDVLQKAQIKLKELKNEPDLAYARWRQVQENSSIHNLGQTFHERREISESRSSIQNVRGSQIIEEIRFRFTRYLCKLYWELYQQGELSEDCIKILSESCDIINDDITKRLNYFQVLSSNFSMETMNIYKYFQRTPFIGALVEKAIIQKVYFMYQISTAFLEAAQQTQHKFALDRGSFPMQTEHNRTVQEEVTKCIKEAASFIFQLENNYPEVIQAVHTIRATTIILKNKKTNLKHMFEEGFVDDADYQILRKEIDANLMELYNQNYHLDDIRINQIVVDLPIFNNLPNAQIATIRAQSPQKVFETGRKIISESKEMNSVYIIIYGSVKEDFRDFYQIKSIGNAINPYDFTYNEPSKCAAKATNRVKVIELSRKTFQDLMARYPAFRKKWYKSLFGYSVRHDRNQQFLQKYFSEKEFRRFVQASQVQIMLPGQMCVCEQGGYLFQGQVIIDGSTYVRGNFISQNKTMKAETETVLLKFHMIVGLSIGHDRISVMNQQI